jgi:uncharacterized glyoxalase superfamily protein PhnB
MCRTGRRTHRAPHCTAEGEQIVSTLLNPYLSFRDTARDAMTFYQAVFGGDLALSTFGEFHASEDPAEADKIMHGMLTSEKGLVLMGADTPNSMDYSPGNNISVSLSGDDEGGTSRLLRQALRRRRHRHRPDGEGSVGRHIRHVHRQVRHRVAGERQRSLGSSCVLAKRPRHRDCDAGHFWPITGAYWALCDPFTVQEFGGDQTHSRMPGRSSKCSRMYSAWASSCWLQ